jgi:hypothetical protein
MKNLISILIISLFICNCSYNLYVVQIPPENAKEFFKGNTSQSREPVDSAGTIGDVSKAPNRNFTDVHNSGNIVYLTIDSQTPKVVSTSASIPVSVTPIP